jgi:hypothetical protein
LANSKGDAGIRQKMGEKKNSARALGLGNTKIDRNMLLSEDNGNKRLLVYWREIRHKIIIISQESIEQLDKVADF